MFRNTRNNKVELCGVDTSTLPVLKNDEMLRLFISYHAGNTSAREQLISGNLKLVLSIVRRFMYRNEASDDLFQVGCIGLMKAIDNFDLSHEVRFSTYAVPMIIGEIRRYLRDNNTVRVSRSLREIAYKAIGVRDSLASQYSREPSVGEISKKMGISREELVKALDAIQDPVSLFEPVYKDGSGEPILLMDQIGDSKARDDQWVDELALNESVSRLNDREKHILSLRFFLGKTQMEVAQEIGISQAQVSRLEKNAIKRARKFLK